MWTPAGKHVWGSSKRILSSFPGRLARRRPHRKATSLDHAFAVSTGLPGGEESASPGCPSRSLPQGGSTNLSPESGGAQQHTPRQEVQPYKTFGSTMPVHDAQQKSPLSPGLLPCLGLPRHLLLTCRHTGQPPALPSSCAKAATCLEARLPECLLRPCCLGQEAPGRLLVALYH